MTARLIALEGIDGSGRTTQAGLLVMALRAAGVPAHATSEPTPGPIGAVLRLALGRRLGRAPAHHGETGAAFVPLDPQVIALLFAADRLDHLTNEIEPRLAAGTTVVADRYVLSSLAYQALDVEPRWLREINARARPADLTLFLDVPPELAIERIGRRGGRLEVYERLETLRRVYANYMACLEDERAGGAAVYVVSGVGTVSEVTQRLLAPLVAQEIERKER